jgi:hypothetical protein
MPLAIDPNATQRIVLDSDKDKNPQPAFIYRHLTYRKFMEFEHNRTSMDAQNPEAAMKKQIEMLQDGLVGWENMGIGFDATKIADLLTLAEVQEVIMRRMLGAVPSVDDKKKLPLPLNSDTASSVPDVKAP